MTIPNSRGKAPPPIATRSLESVALATFQPSPTSPRRSESGIRASVRKTSLNSASPVIWRSGRTSTPGSCMSRMKYESPACLGWSGSVRTIRIARSAMWAEDVHTFWPLTIQVSPSSTARVDRPARSEPAPGSEKSWHHTSSPHHSGRR